MIKPWLALGHRIRDAFSKDQKKEIVAAAAPLVRPIDRRKFLSYLGVAAVGSTVIVSIPSILRVETIVQPDLTAFTPQALRGMRYHIAKWTIPTDQVLMSKDLWTDISNDPEFSSYFDPIAMHNKATASFGF